MGVENDNGKKVGNGKEQNKSGSVANQETVFQEYRRNMNYQAYKRQEY